MKNDKEKTVTIYVNTRSHEWNMKDRISFDEVVTLAFESYSDNENIVYTVNYAKGHEGSHEGSLVKGREVQVKDGMIFNVTQTNKG